MTKPKYYAEIQKLRLIDDELMELCFNDNIECAELLVRVILGRDDLKITSAKTQVTLKGVMREVRLDILAVDDKGRQYNIEFQRKRKGAEPERARLNASMIDANSLDKGGDFTELPDVYVIFITEHDVLGGGLPIYTIDWKINETGEIFGCRSHIVYVNGAHRDSATALGKLVHDIFCERPEEMYYSPFAERVRYFKGSEEGVKEMSSVIEGIINEHEAEIAEDIKEGSASPIIQEAIDRKIAIAMELGRRSAREDMEAEVVRLMTPKLDDLRKEYDAFLMQQKKFYASLMLNDGDLPPNKIAEYTGLSVSTVRRMAKKLQEAQTAQA